MDLGYKVIYRETPIDECSPFRSLLIFLLDFIFNQSLNILSLIDVYELFAIFAFVYDHCCIPFIIFDNDNLSIFLKWV